TVATAGTAALHHDHYGVTRLLVGRERNEPRGMVHQLIAFVGDLRRSRLAANANPGHRGPGARPAGILHVSEHGFAQNFQIALFHPEFIPHPAAWKNDRLRPKGRLWPLGP